MRDNLARLACRLVGMLVLTLLSSGALQATPPHGYSRDPVFRDEFNGNKLDVSKWDFRQLGSVRGDAVMTMDAIKVHDGMLTITTFSEPGEDNAAKIFSGMISTENSFNQIYGYWEVRLRVDYHSGMQPAFWLQSPAIGRPADDPQKAGVEMDIFEHTSGKTDPKAYDHALIWGGYGQGSHSAVTFNRLNSLDDGQFHTFGLAWDPTGYSFYVDGVRTWEKKPGEVPVSQHSEYIILSTEVYSHAPSEGYGSLHTSTAILDVDYVRVYSYIPDDAYLLSTARPDPNGSVDR